MSENKHVGKPCVKCGSTERYTSSGVCVKCKLENSRGYARRYYKENRERRLDYAREYYHKAENIEKKKDIGKNTMRKTRGNFDREVGNMARRTERND